MKLYIVRHGIAIDREDPKCPSEPERYLTAEGIKKTRKMANNLASKVEKPDLLISSPYVRAMQTAEIFAAALGHSKGKIRATNALLPGSEPSALLRELAKEKHSEVVFVFGHAPHIDQLIAVAVASKHAFTELKKAGVALLDLAHVSPPSGKLVWLATPKLFRT
jgi:phosphohistidine phosphatase